MKYRVQLVLKRDYGTEEVRELAVLQKQGEGIEQLGLTLSEGVDSRHSVTVP